MVTAEAIVTVSDVLGEVRRSNLHGRLYPTPRDADRRRALTELESGGEIVWVLLGARALARGGWWAAPQG